MAQFDLSSLEQILLNSNPEEIDQLNQLLTSAGISTQDENRTPCYKCDKKPTGPLDMDKLRNFMEETAKNEEDWPEMVPHVPKKTKKTEIINKKEEIEMDGDLDESIMEALNACDPEDLSELATILGVPGMVALDDSITPDNRMKRIVGYPKQTEEIKWDGINETNFEESLKGLEDNSLRELNLNNKGDIELGDIVNLGRVLKMNKSLKSLSMSAVRLNNEGGRILGEALRENRYLEKLDISSNFVCGWTIVYMLECANVNKTLKEMRLCNQCPLTLGNQAENAILKLIMRNDTIKVFSADFSDNTVRYGVQKKLQDNSFKSRRCV